MFWGVRFSLGPRTNRTIQQNPIAAHWAPAGWTRTEKTVSVINNHPHTPRVAHVSTPGALQARPKDIHALIAAPYRSFRVTCTSGKVTHPVSKALSAN